MSYNKNTIRSSDIDSIIEVLKELKVEYKEEKIGDVTGFGLNDDYSNTDKHVIRKLTYNDYVVLEKIVRTTDCDSNDVIVSKKFKKDKVPKKWKIEETIVND